MYHNGAQPDRLIYRAYKLMSSRRVRLNVGGTIFETTELTLGRIEGTMLKALMEERWAQASGSHNDEIFIDRDSTHFRTILNFLRDGAFTVPKCERETAEVEREAQFYGISELAEICRSQREAIKVGDTVTWHPEAIELYWKTFVRFWVDDSLTLPFVYERNNHTFARCIACDEIQDPKCSYTFEIVEEHWKAMSHYMQHITGTVTQMLGKTCCMLKWSTGRMMHLPVTALCKSANK
ncbi:unnamed protein product [Toxocara canis]|uniref:BTB/POZ domain-containing adapter for CUL3-mediated RhoA degradation protein 3 n=1 Tax=Toxocara canis TaxID=6265 RepID=A0A183UTI6_TOXCA|nr:unnamed protein product [Toxocara canis]